MCSPSLFLRFALVRLRPRHRRRTATKSRHLESIKTALAGCQSSGITSGMDVEVARKTMVELEREAHKLSEQQNMRQALIVASNTKMLDSITEAIAKVGGCAGVCCWSLLAYCALSAGW